eukprot:CAMPEP_0175637918 /NCGR_PEP_ID=MMETSP0097-20121207/2959_1 /TAXON_ID=311494 /ORGANISM="Alexandrium monilatum, Strain CCMP3105" /LENGTH=387 /DNA_ID=CAMNT_0016943611 /DNA_START=18 /DNA_END=1181 /DNA_ORIENTATION=-
MAPAVSVEGIDRMIVDLDDAYKRVLDAQGKSVKLPSAELNLLAIIGNIRDAFLKSLKSSSRDMLDELYGGSCTRVAHIRALIDKLELSPMNASDQRLRGCLNACVSVKEVLVDMGLADVLQKAEEQEKEALASTSFHAAPVEEAPEPSPAAPAEEPAAPAPAPEPAPEEPAPAAEEPAAEEHHAADPLHADIHVKPALGAVVEEEWAELMGVQTCKIGCGRRVAPGKTKSGKAFDTCCRGCATGSSHYKFCGLIDPSKVGEGRCVNGCGRPVADGTDKWGKKLQTCCRGCATGEAHEETCKAVESGGAGADDAAGGKDERVFFSEVKSGLDPLKFNVFLENCRLLMRKSQTFEETVEKVGIIFGKDSPLTAHFRTLVGARLAEVEKA